MKTPFAISKKLLAFLALLIIAVPVHIKVKSMVWVPQINMLLPGIPAPYFSLYNEQGNKIDLHQLRGKGVLLTFCKAGTPRCANQAKHLNSISNKYHHLGLEILFLADRSSTAEIEAFDKETDAEFYILRDVGSRVKDRYGVQEMPASFIVDRHGIIIATFPGSVTLAYVGKKIDLALEGAK